MKDTRQTEGMHELLLYLRSMLELAGFHMDAATSIKLEKLLRFYNVRNAGELVAMKYKLAPLFVTNAEEQERFYRVIESLQERTPGLIADFKQFDDADTHQGKNRLIPFLRKHKYSLLMLVLMAGALYIQDTTTAPATPDKKQADSTIMAAATPVESNDTVNVMQGKEDCNIQPSFHYNIEASTDNKFHVTFTNTTYDTLHCTDRYVWDWGDGSTATFSMMAPDEITHIYTQTGQYTVKLKVFDKNGVTATAARELHLVAIISTRLPDLQLTLAEEAYDRTPLFWAIAILLSAAITGLLLCLALVIQKLIKRAQQRKITRSFDLNTRRTGKTNFTFKDKSHYISFAGVKESIRTVFTTGDSFRRNTIDVPNTIYHTIRKGGFPTPKMKKQKSYQEFIVLIDLGSALNQQSILFDTLLHCIRERGIHCNRYYYRQDPFLVSERKDMQQPFPISSLYRQYGHFSLLIFGTGYGLLTPVHHAAMEQEAPAARYLQMWRKRALITPVMRNNWSSPEKALFNILPLYPSGIAGLLRALQELDTSSRQIFPREDNNLPYTPFPLENDISQYESFFSTDRRLLMWLYALSLADQPDWNITLAIGKALERMWELQNNSPLVTYSNLLLLTSVEWMQTGILNAAHRGEMMAQLRQEEEGEMIIRTAAKAIMALYSEVKPEEGSVLYLQKKINETILYQWLNDDKPQTLSFLQKHDLLDNFTARELAARLKKANTSFIRRMPRLTAAIAIVIILQLTATDTYFPATPDWIKRTFPASVEVDSLVYYNNEACYAMLLPNELLTNRVVYADTLLDKAKTFNDTSRLINQNKKILRYKTGRYLFTTGNYLAALTQFKEITAADIGEIPYKTDSIRVYAELGEARSYYFMGMTEFYPLAWDYLRELSRVTNPKTKLNYDSLTRVPQLQHPGN
ncbi:PKD domain-containing protein [Chitinophaga sp. SYP-B3965]|uniref:PKD domain-containing protein n=1 Tax=Chitinophaga sp. SYP-B3965 TaxID=2663120 RepID=UPI00156423AD|nr:PKD domain-containing protein [Chitinophaga sp. SYP-B3965]